MEEGILKICLKDIVPKKISKKDVSDDYIEIIPKYIQIYHGCWVKYQEKETSIKYPGGYLIDVSQDIVTLRNIKRDIFKVPLYENYFFSKNDCPQHKSVQAIIEEKDRLSRKLEEFNIEKRQFLEKKKKFLTQDLKTHS